MIRKKFSSAFILMGTVLAASSASANMSPALAELAASTVPINMNAEENFLLIITQRSFVT